MNISFETFSPEINETPYNDESPKKLIKRLSYEKAMRAKKEYKNDYILAADTIVYASRKILEKTQDINQAKLNLNFLSGRRHRVYTGVTFLTNQDQYFQYVCKSIVKFKILNDKEINKYLDLNEWKGCAGSYSIQGFAESFVEFLSGSFSNVVGLPIHIIYKVLSHNNLN